jgi:hypothetical protein
MLNTALEIPGRLIIHANMVWGFGVRDLQGLSLAGTCQRVSKKCELSLALFSPHLYGPYLSVRPVYCFSFIPGQNGKNFRLTGPFKRAIQSAFEPQA